MDQQQSKPAVKKQTKQRIKMRMFQHPVKHDGEILEFAPDGSWFVVRFDGPIPDTKFFAYGSRDTSIVTTMPVPKDSGWAVVQGCQAWEVIG